VVVDGLMEGEDDDDDDDDEEEEEDDDEDDSLFGGTSADLCFLELVTCSSLESLFI